MRPGDRRGRAWVGRSQALAARRRVRAEEVGPGGSFRLPVLFRLSPSGAHPAPTSRRSPGNHQGVLIRRPFGEDSVSASPIGDCCLSSLPYSFPSASPPAPALSAGISPYLSLVSPRLKYKTLIFGGVFETSQRAWVERERIIFKVLHAAVAAFSFWH